MDSLDRAVAEARAEGLIAPEPEPVVEPGPSPAEPAAPAKAKSEAATGDPNGTVVFAFRLTLAQREGIARAARLEGFGARGKGGAGEWVRAALEIVVADVLAKHGVCSACVALMINGVFCHETGCPMAPKGR